MDWASASDNRRLSQLYPRSIRGSVAAALADTRVVFLAGARQVGKTTLTRQIAAGEHPMTVLSLDETAAREAATRDPAGFLAGLDGPVAIDEVQHAADLLLEIKSAVDRDTRPGRFAPTGRSRRSRSRRAPR